MEQYVGDPQLLYIILSHRPVLISDKFHEMTLSSLFYITIYVKIQIWYFWNSSSKIS